MCIQLTCPYGTCICRWLCSNLILCPAASYGCVSVDMPYSIMHIALSCGVTIGNRNAHSITVRLSFSVQTLATTSTLCECCRHREACIGRQYMWTFSGEISLPWYVALRCPLTEICRLSVAASTHYVSRIGVQLNSRRGGARWHAVGEYR